MKKEDFKGWSDVETPLPRLWINIGDRNFLLQWTSVCQVSADAYFKELMFATECGVFTLRSQGSLKDLFEAMQSEKVRKIEACNLLRITFVEPKEE